uniref:C2H2-type domain-containing protein n=1 Tax=Kryptolebias marmoratus TaxID=37003 RepID=A0A3Q3AQX1_KRYMA
KGSLDSHTIGYLHPPPPDDSMLHRSVDELQLHSGELNSFPMMSESQMQQRTQPTIADRLIDNATMSSLAENTNPPSAAVENLDYANSIQTNATKELSFLPKPVKPAKRFECLFCGKIFNYLSSLKVHIRRHSGEKPFSCSVCDCGKSFSQKSSLNIHLRTHTGEKPYSCMDCGKCYAYKYGLNHHQCFNWMIKPEVFDGGALSTAQNDITCGSMSIQTSSMDEMNLFETKKGNL